MDLCFHLDNYCLISGQLVMHCHYLTFKSIHKKFSIFINVFIVLSSLYFLYLPRSTSSNIHKELYMHCSARKLYVVHLCLHSMYTLLTLFVWLYYQVSPLTMPCVFGMMAQKSMTVTVTLWPGQSPHMSSALERNVLQGTVFAILTY